MSNILNGITEAKRSPEPDYDDPSWDEKVSNVGQKAKQAEVLKSKGKEPKTRWNPETKKYYVDFSDDDVKKESVGLPYPGTYEETNDMFKSSGQKRIGTLTTEQGVAEGVEIKIPTEDGITMQDIRLMAGEGKLTRKTVLQAIDIIRKQRRPQGVAEAYGRYDRRDAYQRDYDHSVAGMNRPGNHRDDERHDLDPTDWYIVKDGKMLKASVYPRQVQQAIAQGFSPSREEAQANAGQQGVAEGSLNEGQYEMMMRNGQVKKFIAKDDADAKRIAAGHGAKSVIRMKGNVPSDKIGEQGVAEGLDDTASATPAKNERGRFTAWDDDEPMRLKCEDGEFRTIQEINNLRQKIGMKSFSIKSQQGVEEEKQRLDPKCWTGKHKEGTKMKGGVRVNNCVPNESAIMKGIKV